MKEDYYIAAAIELGLIEGVGHHISDDNSIINDTIDVNESIINKAIYLEKLSEIRSKRDKVLTATDWVGLTDNQLDDDLKLAMINYRQQLRDCPSILIEGSENEFEFPVAPDK